jgi:MoxR-like ATPase
MFLCRYLRAKRRLTVSSVRTQVTVFGDIKVVNNATTKQELVPSSHLLNGQRLPAEINGHLRWMAQKYNLNQDCLLIGHPTSLRRAIVLKFCEEIGLETELLSITRDTVACDLTQRREISKNSILFVDQAVVRAAKSGRVLVLDGLEKAEKNILPTLNNLLENREMALEDGTFLLNKATYDKVVSENKGVDTISNRLIPVHPNFWVVALSTPTPPYISNSSLNIDPPLRSRFQSRYIDELKTDSIISLLSSSAIQQAHFSYNKQNDANMIQVISFYETLNIFRQQSLREDSDNSVSLLPIFSLKNVYNTMKLLNMDAAVSVEDALRANTLPYQLIQSYVHDKYKILIEKIYKKFKLLPVSSPASPVTTSAFREQTRILRQLKLDYKASKHTLLVGNKGVGKTFLTNLFLSQLPTDASHQSMQLYSELSARDLLQRRVTDENGDSKWVSSPLISALKRGDTVVLDGFNRLEVSALAIIRRILNDHRIELPDGTIAQIHPSFRIIALATPPVNKSEYRDRYLMADLPFSIHFIDENVMFQDKIADLVKVNTPESLLLSALMELVGGKSKRSSPFNFSLKQVYTLEKLIARKKSAGVSEQDLHQYIRKKLDDMLMVQYLPNSLKEKYEGVLKKVKLLPINTSTAANKAVVHPSISADGKYLQVGDKKILRQSISKNPEKVPFPLYHDNATHTKLITELLTHSFEGPEKDPILLIGNQGVGKNKIIDRLLYLLQIEKEYVQLHRDSSIHSLTVLPTLIDGRIIFEDSPLVKAVKYGRTLVVDEVDKASSEVVFVLKALAEDQEIYLGDGRRIVTGAAGRGVDENIIVKHPNFRLILLANPGIHPFQGNDFFKTCGDSFLPYVMNELDIESEVELLTSFGPAVDKQLVSNIALVFSDLRADYLQGKINYPFSSRESVSIIKHLQAYPQDSVSAALENVVSFDSLTPSIRNHILSRFKKRGVDISQEQLNELLEWDIQKYSTSGQAGDTSLTSSPKTDANSAPKHGKIDPNNKPHVGGITWAGGSGGSNTAGLGGRGGPYRLDSGNPVHQISDIDKAAVSEKITNEAMKMAKESLEKRLKDIKMEKFEFNAYLRFYSKVEAHVSQLKSVLVTNRHVNDREWLRNQSQGELDETRLIDGILGEKNIYKKRSPG